MTINYVDNKKICTLYCVRMILFWKGGMLRSCEECFGNGEIYFRMKRRWSVVFGMNT
jgi:hypothetical protein